MAHISYLSCIRRYRIWPQRIIFSRIRTYPCRDFLSYFSICFKCLILNFNTILYEKIWVLNKVKEKWIDDNWRLQDNISKSNVLCSKTVLLRNSEISEYNNAFKTSSSCSFIWVTRLLFYLFGLRLPYFPQSCFMFRAVYIICIRQFVT